jgi:hypothetical protein
MSPAIVTTVPMPAVVVAMAVIAAMAASVVARLCLARRDLAHDERSHARRQRPGHCQSGETAPGQRLSRVARHDVFHHFPVLPGAALPRPNTANHSRSPPVGESCD